MEYQEDSSQCPACDHTGNPKGKDGVRTCQVCGAVFGFITERRYKKYIVSEWETEEYESQVYFDFTVYPPRHGAPECRIHGWFNPANKKIIQIG